MTDYPAVIYIKASRPNPDQEDYELVQGSPSRKKSKREDGDSIREMFAELNEEIFEKMDNIEKRLDILSDYSDALSEKLDLATRHLSCFRTAAVNRLSADDNGVPTAIPVPSRLTFITLNREEDYPQGSWLGNPDDPGHRVRCHISPTDLFHIHTTCTTAEKMALTLLDYLFDRETQACSNISGTGKHRKRQLDPLFIYGVQCHLNFHFGTSEQEWSRIKQNMDSKCRTAFRRKSKGLPLLSKPSSLQNTPLRSSQFNISTDHLDFPEALTADNFIEDLASEKYTFRVVKSESESIVLETAIKETVDLWDNLATKWDIVIGGKKSDDNSGS